MGRAERRAYNKKYKAKLTREQFDLFIALARINAGNFDLSDLQVSSDFMHMDNVELVPEGCPCKLNYDAIMSRPKVDKQPAFLEWVEQHKDVELHVTRENAVNSLICFKEDERYTKDLDTGEEIRIEPWLFDVYTDILIKDEDGSYKTVIEIEDKKALAPIVNEEIVAEQDTKQSK